ncbi:hypothetical protein HUJ05_012209 [Dendroctonus ponderosae]|nr:hypothetical protein HUJ05_012209 [Dendroctonus ponderosae]
MEDEEYKKLSVEERCVHKLWKARVSAYEELVKLFRQLDDEKSPEFGKYLGLVKKFVTDSNAMGQEKGLEATLAYVENYVHAGKTVSEVMSGIVLKCLAAPRTKTRELALQVSLMFVEIEKFDAVQEELLKGTEQKNPKIVAACIQTLTTALREFGIKVIGPKPMVKRIGVLFSGRDKAVRDEARAMEPFSSGKLAAGTNGRTCGGICQNDEEEETPDEGAEDIDPYELASPVDILSKLPKDFYEKIEAKKWQERKESLDAVENLLKNPKLEAGDYGDLVRALKKVIQKDSNVVCVALAGKCIAGLATGLKKRFQTYSGTLVLPLLEKFKEKKQNVLTAIREAIDAIYLSTSLEAILDDVLEALGNKNPTVKSEVALFLARAFTKTQPVAVNKKLLKSVTTALTKNINESDPAVRESSADALGTLMKLVGEKAIGPFLVELEKDKLKMDKIKEFCEKAEITIKVPAAKKAKSTSSIVPQEQTVPKIVKKVVPGKTGPAKKKPSATTISSGSATVVRSKGAKSASVKPVLKIEKELEDGEVESIIADILAENVIMELSNPMWKTRLNAVEEILTKIQSMENKSIPSQAFVKTLMKKPGLKDTNFQVIHTLTAMAEATSLGHVSSTMLSAIFAQKSPKIQQEGLTWLTTALKEFGIASVDVKALIDSCKIALSSANSAKSASSDSLDEIGHEAVGQNEPVINVRDLLPRVNISGQITEALLNEMSGKAWQERMEALTKLNNIIQEAKFIKPNLGDLPQPLAARLTDSNVKIAQTALNICQSITKSMGSSSKQYIRIWFSGFIQNLGDSKAWMRTAARETINAFSEQCGYKEFFEGEIISDALKSGSPTLRKSWCYAYRFESMHKQTEKLKPGSKSIVITALEKARAYLPEKPLPKKAQVIEKKTVKGNTLVATKQNAVKPKGSSSPAKRNVSPTGRKKDDDNDTSPLLVVNNLKHQRTIDESKLKVLKWNFTQPRDEFIDLLKDQMTAANVNKTLMFNMFHADFRFHIKAIEALMEDLPDHSEALISNLDLILKWLTLRFFDTNPSVLLKGLEYLHAIFNMLSENQYRMLENEGSSFMPYLISDKDMSLLEERIKRTSRKTVILKSEVNPSVPEVPLPTKKVCSRNDTTVFKSDEDQDVEEEPLSVPVPTLPSAVPFEQPKKEIQGPFKLESEIMNDLDKITPYYERIPTVEVDYGFLSEELKMPSFFDNKVKIMPLSPPKPVTTRVSNSPNGSGSDPDLSRSIKLIASQNLVLGLQGVEQCLEYMNNPLKVQVFPEHENEFFEAITSLLQYLRTLDPLTNPTAAKIYRNFCSKPQLGANLRVESIKQIMNELLTLLVEEKLDKCGGAYFRVINSNCAKIIELSAHTNVGSENSSERHVDLVMKCLWKVIRLMPTWGDAVDYERVLLDVHNFLVKFPPSWWSSRPMDTPLKTIKTILHSIVKCKGASSMQLLRKIPNPAESDIESYMQRLLKSFKIAQAQDVPLQSQKNSLSRANHNMLTDIFQKIGNKENTKDGLNLLYDFIQQHPEADIEPFLSKSSKFFQEYIQTGLKEIDSIRRIAKHSNSGEPNSDEEIDPEKTPEYFEERLKTWRFIWDELMAGRTVDDALWPLDPNNP